MQLKRVSEVIPVVVALSVGLLVVGVQTADYLKKAPSFLKPCQLHVEGESPCLAATIQSVFSNWRNGIPGLRGLSAIDPLRIKRIHVEQKTENVVDLKVDMKNVLILGLGDTKIVKSFISDNYKLKFQVKIPLISLRGTYRLKGLILALNLNGTGKMENDISNVELDVVFDTQLVRRSDEYFVDVKSVRTNIKRVGGFRVNFHNLFGGNRALEDSANDVFNQSWQDLFVIMRPAITQTLDAVTSERYKRIFAFVPARFFFDDLP